MKQVSFVGPLGHWAIGPLGHCPLCAMLVAGGLLMLAPEAHANWVLVKLQGKIVETSQNKRDGGTMSGTPQSRDSVATSGWGGAMQITGSAAAQLPAPSQNTYGGETAQYIGGEAVASVVGNTFKAFLEWQGSGTPTNDCSLIISSSGEVYAGGSAGAEPSGSLSVDSGAKTGDNSYPAKVDGTLTTEPAPKGSDYAAYMAYSDWMNKYPNGISEKRLRAAGVTRIPVSTRSKVLTAGRYTVETSIDMSLLSKSSIATKGSDTSARVNANLYFKVDPSQQGLYIFSGLEPSYRKGANGQREQIERGDDGSMTIESAAQWTTSSDPAINFKSWLGGTQFTANATGFTSPIYKWTEPANSRNQNTGLTPAVDNLNPAATTSNTPYYGISLGSKRNGSDLTKSSTIKVDVGDLSNSYTVNWHLPSDNWNKIDELPYPKLVFTKAGYAVDTNGDTKFEVHANRTLTFDIPVDSIEFDWEKTGKFTSLFLNTAGAGVGLYVAGAGAAAAVPGAAVVVALTAAAGITDLATSDKDPAPTPESRQADYDKYKAAMRLQKQINVARATDPTAYPNEETRCADAGFVNAAIAEIDRVEQLSGGTASWDQDKFFSEKDGQLLCSGKMGRYRHQEVWKGDKYGPNGYEGPTNLDILRHEALFDVLIWRFQANGGPVPTTTPTPGG